MRTKFNLLFFVFLISSSSLAKTKFNPYKNMIFYTRCDRKFDKRPIWIEKKENRGCLLWYSKYAKGGHAANSNKGTEFCFKIANQIVKNLTSDGFVCNQRDVDSFKNLFK